MNLKLILKACGLKIPDADVSKLEELVPTLPAKVVEAQNFLVDWVKNFHERISALEKQNLEIIQLLKEQNGRRIDTTGSHHHDSTSNPAAGNGTGIGR